MKNKISKILGVVLALTVLAGLLISAVPASAAILDMTWSSQGAPAAEPFKVLLPDTKSTGAWLYDVSVDGQTIFAINYDNTTTVTLYKSTNGGLTFSTAALGVNLPASVPVDIAISSDYANDSTVMVATATQLWRSVNGGATFTNYVNVGSLPNGGTTINAIAVGPSYDGGQAILVATDNGASRFTNNSGWQNLGFTGNVLDIAFSPNHGKGDAEVLAVTGNASAIYLDTKSGTNNVNVDVGRATLFTTTTPPLTINHASIAFAADYDMYSNNRVFVGLGIAGIGAQTTGDGMDVYRVTGILGGNSLTTRLNVGGTGTNTNVYSVAFKGNVADGWLYVGIQNPGMGPKVWRATSANASTVTFIPNAKSPTGIYNTDVKCLRSATDTKIFAMVSGAGSALSVSTDGGVTFNQISLINISASANVNFVDLNIVDANNLFLIMVDNAPVAGGIYSRLFKTTDGGANWQSVLSTTEAAFTANANDCLKAIYPSPAYATDKTLYVTSGTYKIYKSSNEGLTYTTYSSPNSVDIVAFLPIDANSYLIGAASGIYKSGSYTATAISGQTPYSFAYISDTDIFVGTVNGSVYRSTNGGASYLPVGAPNSLGANVIVKTDVGYATNKVVYAASTTGVYRWTIDTSASWSTLKAGNVASISQTSDGTIYANDTTTPTGHTYQAQIQRCTTPTAPVTTWDTMIAYGATAAGAAVTGLQGYVSETNNPVSGKVVAVSTGTAQVPNNTVYSLVASTLGPYIYGVKDTVVAAPTISSPAADSQVASNSNFMWGAVATAYAPIKYDLQVGYDAAFSSLVINATSTGTGQVSGTLYVPGAGILQAGQTYYWRVRVGTGSPMASKWSATTKFAVQLSGTNLELAGIGGLSLQPAAGASNVPLKPVFQWAAVTGAMSYDLQVADNPVFVNPLDSQTGLNTNVWTYTKTLENNKTYYWRVRAVSASGVAGSWTASAFTTEAKEGPAVTAPPATVTVTSSIPVVTPTVTVNIPSQPAPIVTVNQPPVTTTSATTPASIWVLIAIGAILIIAVIVLIARTRRV